MISSYEAMEKLCDLARRLRSTIGEAKVEVIENKERSKSTVQKIKVQHQEKAKVKLKNNKVSPKFMKNTCTHGRVR